METSFAPVLSATTSFVCICIMIVTSLFSVYYGSLFDDADNAESLELAEGARFHDLYFVSEGAFAFFVMAMNYRLAADFFAVKGMRNLVKICEFYALFTRERRYDAHDGFA